MSFKSYHLWRGALIQPFSEGMTILGMSFVLKYFFRVIFEEICLIKANDLLGLRAKGL